MAEGIILAGGESRRANTNKLLLQVNGKSIIRHTIDSMKPYVDKIIVVTGKYHDELLPYLFDVEVAHNEQYERGMFSSVLTGVEHVHDDFFIIPGDIAFVSGEVFEALLGGSFSLRVPAYKGKTGHPLYVSKKHINDLLAQNVSSNLKDFISNYEVEKIDVDDPYINIDLDTLDDFSFIVKEKERN